mmetsp:Transcript_20483/g.28732  ORF Transcript_20483/g.28732 Transcript_20483/m.28732 type:complete len:189 (+) Transcript_20483:42-608(+)
MALKHIRHYATPREVMDGWKAFWATFGVVSALIATIAYSALLAYPGDPKEPYSSNKDALRYGYGVCVGSSFVFSMISVISATLFYVQVDKLPPDDEEITFGFIEKYEFLMGTIPVGSFMLSIAGLVTSVLLWYMMTWGGVLGILLYLVAMAATILFGFVTMTMNAETTRLQAQRAAKGRKDATEIPLT